ncbi:hypothetical protein ZWY2020_017356 [Hordeum vulgare]|nr:hypothetical protein ZWY2020_017356 [Hordeum vulgare]
MVSWSDDDTNENSYQYVDLVSNDDISKIHATTVDCDFEGIETDVLVLCHEHGHTTKRHEGDNHGLVEWIDPSWPTTMGNALAKLWDMYEECKRNKIEDNLMNSFVVHNLTRKKIKLHASYEKLVEDVNALLDAHEQRARMERKPDKRNVIRNMKLKLAEKKSKLQAHIIELEKVVE